MKLPSMTLDRHSLLRFESVIEKEWLVTNGLGGYASSTALGINTRKYHGLLVAAFQPPGDRRVCLAKLDEEIAIKRDLLSLGANEFQGEIFPKGYETLRRFSVVAFPKYFYSIQNVEVEKAIFMPRATNVAITLYSISNKNSVDIKFRVFPLTSWRHFHSVINKSEIPSEPKQEYKDNEALIIANASRSALLLASTSGQYYLKPEWIERIYYREEAVRGESCLDDCYQPGYFEVCVEACENRDFAVTAVADENEEAARRAVSSLPSTISGIRALYIEEMERCENVRNRLHETRIKLFGGDWLSWLLAATDAFLVMEANNEREALIAGYHWFETWGRDTFISLPGLTLVTRRFEDAKRLFLNFGRYCKDGLIPNFLPDQMRNAEYNTVDATLWYVNAVLQYLKYTGDFEFVKRELWTTLKAAFEKHLSGTVFNIHAEDDGLLSHGPKLTWMDAAVNGEAVTPRAGKAVEIQALWYNALRTMELIAHRFKEKSEEAFAKMAEKAKKSFARRFWNSEKNGLYDVVDEHESDISLRPNQIIAVSLDFVMLDRSRNDAIIEALRRELLTSYGLRTLDKNDPRYMGTYVGDRRSRDRAYHNGTVWPWLQGPFITAFLKTKGYSEFRREYAFENFLAPIFTKHIFDAGLGYVSEIFDGDFPHKPRGCVAQAWSVAEPLRAYIEDILQIRPPYEKQVLGLC